MPSFEEEAFARAQQINRHQPFHHGSQQSVKPSAKQEQTNKEQSKQENEEQPSEKAFAPKQQGNANLLDMMFKNKEQSLILLLLVLLMDENTDPALLLALIYLLI